jgi:hypothetical protein
LKWILDKTYEEEMEKISNEITTAINLIDEYSQVKRNALRLKKRLYQQNRRSMEPELETGMTIVLIMQLKYPKKEKIQEGAYWTWRHPKPQ